MGTKNEPGQFDCFDAALPDEPVFVLLGRDTQAPGLVHMWAYEREHGIAEGRFPESDRAKVAEAKRFAAHMIDWRHRNDGAWRAKNPELPLCARASSDRFCAECGSDAAEQPCMRDSAQAPAVNFEVPTDTSPMCDCARVHNGLGVVGRLCDCCVRDGEQASFGIVHAVSALNAHTLDTDALGGRVEKPRLFGPDFAIHLHRPLTADTAEAVSAMRCGPDTSET